jgi:hypothetical protein
MSDLERNQEPVAETGETQPAPNGLRMFMGSFSGVVIVGLIIVFIKPALEQAGQSLSPAMAEAKAVVDDVSEIRNQHWYKDRTLYLHSSGTRLATDEEVSEYKAWQEEMDEAMERNREIMEDQSW